MAKPPELCPVETTARIVGGRWKAAVLEQLFQSTKRFSELKRGITGITQRALAQQLGDLQSTGIVERKVLDSMNQSNAWTHKQFASTIRNNERA